MIAVDKRLKAASSSHQRRTFSVASSRVAFSSTKADIIVHPGPRRRTRGGGLQEHLLEVQGRRRRIFDQERVRGACGRGGREEPGE